MKIINKAYKFRLYPSKEQISLLAQHFGSVRFVYNYFLARRKEQYEHTGKSPNYYQQAKELTELKKNSEYSWLYNTSSGALQHSLRYLETAYVNFYRKIAKFPRFHSKKSGGSFEVPKGFKVKNGKIHLPKFREGIKFVDSQKIEGTIKHLTISVTPSGKYYVSILTQVEYQPYEKTNQKVGIDLGIKNLMVTSDGDRYSSNKFIKKYSKQLATAQKHLSRKKKGSNSWNRQRIKVARLQEKIANCRRDKLHKISTDLVRNYDVICCESLNVKSMVKNHSLSQSISDAGWGMFLNMLQYKADWNDKQLIKVDRFYPSSKTCHHCGYVKEDLTLADRYWVCPQCGETIDRDLNAAQNILDEGLRSISAGTVDHTDGEDVRPARRQIPMKSEAHEPIA